MAELDINLLFFLVNLKFRGRTFILINENGRKYTYIAYVDASYFKCI